MRTFGLVFKRAVLFAFGWAIAACGWDWTLRASDVEDGGSDASASSDGGSVDAFVEAATSDASADASACSGLLAAVASAKAQAITCTLGSVPDCSAQIPDECGCGVFVGQNGSTASQHFASAVDQAKAAGCTSHCAGCTALPTRGTCIENGATFTCSPP